MKILKNVSHDEAKRLILAKISGLVAAAPNAESAASGKNLLAWMEAKPTEFFSVINATDSYVEAAAFNLAGVYSKEIAK